MIDKCYIAKDRKFTYSKMHKKWHNNGLAVSTYLCLYTILLLCLMGIVIILLIHSPRTKTRAGLYVGLET